MLIQLDRRTQIPGGSEVLVLKLEDGGILTAGSGSNQHGGDSYAR